VISLTLHVAMQIGLYLHRIEFGVWRVVSEDSDHFRARLTVIHCLHDRNDLQQPTWSEVRIRSDDLHARGCRIAGCNANVPRRTTVASSADTRCSSHLA
jgi:hypothetical protein